MGKKNKVMNLFLAIIAMLAFNTHYEIINIEQIRNITNDEGRLITVLYRFFLSYKNFQITYFLLTIAIGYFVYYSLNKFTYNKTLQKMRESYRIADEQKILLKEMKRK